MGMGSVDSNSPHNISQHLSSTIFGPCVALCQGPLVERVIPLSPCKEACLASLGPSGWSRRSRRSRRAAGAGNWPLYCVFSLYRVFAFFGLFFRKKEKIKFFSVFSKKKLSCKYPILQGFLHFFVFLQKKGCYFDFNFLLFLLTLTMPLDAAQRGEKK